MPNRYTRDELVKIAIDMAQVPNLKAHDYPQGVVQPDAYSIQWLQDIIDFWHHMIPFSSGVAYTQLNITANSQSITLPTDFILDVRNGYIAQRTIEVSSKTRLRRLPLQKWVSADLYYGGAPAPCTRYYMIQGSVLKVTPTPSTNMNAWLWYYSLPAALQSSEKPTFPSDYVLIEYVRLRALEWCGLLKPGSAKEFCDKIATGMRANGLMNEPEDDELPADLTSHGGYRYTTPYDWMGAR